MPQLICGPLIRFVGMTRRAGIWNAGLRRLHRSNKPESVRRNEVAFNGLLDVRHVTRNAVAAGAVFCVVRMFAHGTLQARGVLAVVATETERVPLLNKVRFVPVTVNVVAIKATQPAVIHGALNEVISLHAIFVSGQVGELQEIGSSRLQLFKLPVVG